MFCNMRFYDCDFWIHGETENGKVFKKKGTTGLLKPVDELEPDGCESNQLSRLGPISEALPKIESSRLRYESRPRAQASAISIYPRAHRDNEELLADEDGLAYDRQEIWTQPKDYQNSQQSQQ